MEKLITTPAITYPNFGPYLTYAESVKSATAIRKGIINTPTPEYYQNMAQVYAHIIRPIFDQWGRKSVSSFYRSPSLNKAIGGAANSQHLYGQAVDIDCDGISGITNRRLFDWVRAGNFSVDQCIEEFPDSLGNPGWIHLSWVSPEKNRGNFLRAVKKGGKTSYITV